MQKLENGIITRYMKKKWIQDSSGEIQISSEAFDLRENPPERYISFFQISCCDIDDEKTRYERANLVISRKLKGSNGGISIFSIPDTLKKINKNKDVIKFTEQNMPHCGMVYLSNNKQEILRAKSRLCVLARDSLKLSHMRWSKSGVWERVLEVLSQDADNEYAMIDSTIVRAHQHSSGAEKGGGASGAAGAD